MADTSVHPFPSTAIVQKCKITLANGDAYDFKNNIVEMSYYEDLYGFCVSGYVMLRDGVGFLEAFGISGGEKLELLFSGGSHPLPDMFTRSYMIYKVGDRNPTGNMNSEFYKLYFCTRDLLVNEQVKVSKSYKGKKISDIVSDVLENFLSTKRDFIRIEETTGVYDFVIPMRKPYEAISWLSNYAIPGGTGKSGPVGADMFLFEDFYGYRFASLNSLMLRDVSEKRIYKYQQNNLNDESPNLELEQRSVLAIEFVRSFNLLKDVAAGAFANKVIAFDPITKTTTVQTFDYKKYINEIQPANGNGINPNITTPTGLKPNETPDTNLKVVMTNSGQKSANYIKNTDSAAVSQDLYAQQVFSQRTAQIALMNHTVLKILVPGDHTLTVGETLEFRYYKLGMSTNSRELDNTYSGKYLITAVRHIIQSSGVFQTVLEIAKDSSKKPLPSQSQG